MAGVGTEKVFENDKVIVWNFALEPGQETPMHTH
jgi:quercetin dioxygenase-like cupin family protein